MVGQVSRRGAISLRPVLFLALITVGASLITGAAARSAEEWRSRSVYQVVTDRFARYYRWGYCDVSKYCGGSFKGLMYNLDYIKALGFDAIWISPVVENTENGYHGYWAKNMLRINPHFGTANELKELVRRAHRKGIWVMVDVVANHMGYVQYDDFSSMVPFNRREHYHSCAGCGRWCSIDNFDNEWQVEHCRLAGLPDLNQNHPYVRQFLLHWIRQLVQEFNFDGIRIDTVPEVDKGFWKEFVDSAGVFAIGENFDGRVERIAKYQGDAIDSMLDYPMYYTLRDVFQRRRDMNLIPYRRGQELAHFDDLRVLGLFVDNHDNPRFLADQWDESLYMNALAYVLLGEGIPFVYYGTEQGFSGSHDPQNREPMWNSRFARNGRLFSFISTLNRHRKETKIWNYDHVALHVSSRCYVFMRGDTIVVLTNMGSYGYGATCTIHAAYILYPSQTLNIVYPRQASFRQYTYGDIEFHFYRGMPIILKREEPWRPGGYSSRKELAQ